MLNKTRSFMYAFKLIPLFLIFVLILTMIVPLVSMFMELKADSITAVFKGDLLNVLGNSLLSSLITTVISMVFAFALAWCIERTAIPMKRIIRILASLPMLIPSVSIGMGVILLGGNNGILTNIFGIEGGGIYGLWGIVWGSVMYSFPVAFLMFANVLRYEDSAAYEAAEILSIPPVHRFLSITLPYLRKPVISIAFSVFTLSFTDYGVPLMVGGKFKTLPIVMYQEVIGQLDFGKGCVFGAIMLVPAVIAFVADYFNKDDGKSSFVTRPFVLKKNKVKDGIALVISMVLTLFSVLPILSFIVLAFVKKYPSDLGLTLANIAKTFQANGGKYLLNSLIIAVAVAAVGTVICILIAYFTARSSGKIVSALHLSAISTASVPGIVLGLAYVLAFKSTPVYGTMIILIMVNIIHFLSSPYLMIYTSFLKVNRNMEAAASTLGIGRMRLLLDIMLVGCKDTVVEMFSYLFVNSMMTISAVSFLANTRNKPIALMINQFEAQTQMEYAAVVSLMILLLNLAVKVIGERKKLKNK